MNTTSEIQMVTEKKSIGNLFTIYFNLLRGKQWIKNGFVFIPIMLLFKLPTLLQLRRITIGAALFCLISSCIYIFNDLIDVECDRKHPVKKYRPIASGKVSIRKAIVIEVVLTLITLISSWCFKKEFFGVVLTYFLLNIAYSLKLKKYIFIDVVIISLGFILRVLAGFLLLNIPLNEKVCIYFLVFIMFLTLFIGMGKRKGEIGVLEGESKSHRKSLEFYSIELIDQLMLILITCAIMTYILFIIEVNVLLAYLTVPLLLYGIFRYQYLGKNANVLGKPDKMIFMDRPLRYCIIMWGITFISICIQKTF